ncbi:hypothetical protein [Nonomuraea soli]|uniref:Uncharacterized protein n=1 Tax=Nonomuraea soli TaxID=1032476 RepID=A0A7W0CSX7_9ACTN|nr:hypothetical protein [Nonomuraea soli]MBA2896570.1 hypothetical protein [Nonomuraea soli]
MSKRMAWSAKFVLVAGLVAAPVAGTAATAVSAAPTPGPIVTLDDSTWT